MAHIDRRDRNGTVRYVARYIDPTGQELHPAGGCAEVPDRD
jgi:hypothetical protein